MFENPSCIRCSLGSTAKNRCLPNVGNKNCNVAIFLPYPDYMEDRRGRSMVGQRADFVRWCLKKMGVGIENVLLDYTIKCYPKKLPGKKADRMEIVRACRYYLAGSLQHYKRLRALVALGGISSEVFTGHTQIGNAEGTSWPVYEPALKSQLSHVWVAYDPAAVMENPSLSGSIYRVIFKACEEAGLKPEPIMGVPTFEFNR